MDDLHRPYLFFKGVGYAKCEGISAYPCAFAGTRICSGLAASSNPQPYWYFSSSISPVRRSNETGSTLVLCPSS